MSINSAGISSMGAMGAAGSGEKDNWFQAIAEVWGEKLNSKAQAMQDLATGPDGVANGGSDPATMTQLTGAALEFQFLSQSAHTQLTSIGSGLETAARKG